MFQNGPSDRMQFVGMGELTHPGKCMVCGSGNREEGYVRLGVYFDYEGEMYLCFLCLVQAAEIIGMLTKEEVETIVAQATAFMNKVTTLQAELDKANERLAGYDSLFRDQFVNVALNDPALSASLMEEQSAESGATVSGGTEDTESSEPVTESRRANSGEFTEVDFDASRAGDSEINL